MSYAGVESDEQYMRAVAGLVRARPDCGREGNDDEKGIWQ